MPAIRHARPSLTNTTAIPPDSAENSALSNMHFYALICLLTHVLRFGPRDWPKWVAGLVGVLKGDRSSPTRPAGPKVSMAVSRPRLPGSACALSGHDVHRPVGSAGDVGGLRQSAVLPNPPAEEIKVRLRAED